MPDVTVSNDIDAFLKTANDAAARAELGVAIGTDVQAYAAILDDLGAVTPPVGADEVLVSTGAGTFALESGATLQASLGLAIGSNVQAYSAALDAVTGTNTGDEVQADQTTAGIAEVATVAEIDAGTLDTHLITPLGLAGSQLQTDVTANNAKVSNVTTNLGYTASPTDGTVTSSDGTDATLTLATGVNAGLLAPADFTTLSNTSGTNTGDQDLSGLQPKPAEGQFVDGDKTKLDGIEPSADVTDAANVESSLSGATLTSATVAGTDKVLIQDADAADALKTVTAQSIADLGGGGTVQGTDATYDIQATNEGATAGNARGENSVDLQTQRSAATQIASGANSVVAGGENNSATYKYAVIGGGYGNTASGGYNSITLTDVGNVVGGGYNNLCTGPTGNVIGGGINNSSTASLYFGSTVSGGYGNTASGEGSTVGGGLNNSASGYYSFVGCGRNNAANASFDTVAGGFSNTASGNYSTVIGGMYGKADRFGQVAHASGQFGAQGDAQHSIYVMRRSVTHVATTWYGLGLNGSDPVSSSSNRLLIPANTVYTGKASIVGTTQGQTKSYGFEILFVAERAATAASTVIKSSAVTIIDDTDDATIDARVTADTTNGQILVEVSSGTQTDTIRWVATVDITQVTWS